MTKVENQILEIKRKLADNSSECHGDFNETMMDACRLLQMLNDENDDLRKSVFRIENKKAICVSNIFPVSMSDNKDSKDEEEERQVFLLQEHILQKLADGITVQDTDFNIIYQNDAMQRAFGNHVGDKCYSIYEKRSAICEGCGVAKSFQTGEAVLTLRTAYENDGTTSFWENACFPIFDSHGKIIAGAEVCRNVSERVSLEREVKDRNIQLAQLNEQLKMQKEELTNALHQRELTEQELKKEMERRERTEVQLMHAHKLQAVGQLSAGLSHEINTPTQYIGNNLVFLHDSFQDLWSLLGEYKRGLAAFAAISGHTEVANKINEIENNIDLAYLEETVPIAIEDAQKGVSRISLIVEAMKDFAHPSQGEKSLADLNKAILKTITITQNEFKDIADIETELASLPLVSCYISDVNQAFLHLLVNASEAIADEKTKTGSRGRIRITTSLEENQVRIAIEDTGCGIPPELNDRIFEPFFTTKDAKKGGGLGLAIAYSIIVNKHGGSLSFTSEVGKGTTFSIHLPINSESEQANESNLTFGK